MLVMLEDLINSSNGLISIIAATVGGILVRNFDKFLSKRGETFTEGVQIRKELREDLSIAKKELADMKLEIEKLEEENEIWETEYKKLLNQIREKNSTLLNEIDFFRE